jgi:hypothetical protein
MAKVVIILVRVFFAVSLGLVGVFALGQGIAALSFKDFAFFGWPGAMMTLGIAAGAGLLYASWRLFKTTLAMPAV